VESKRALWDKVSHNRARKVHMILTNVANRLKDTIQPWAKAKQGIHELLL
jgi:hypothetical protein